MKNRKFIISTIAGATLIILLIIGIVINKNVEKENTENIINNEKQATTENLDLTGEKYIPSKIYDEQNNEIKLSEYSDKPMAVLFFNTTELATTNVIEILQKHYDTYKDKINFVNICVIDGVTETKEDVKEFINSKSITMPILYDTDYLAKNEYNIDVIPTIVFINKNNEIINTISGEKNEDVIQANLDILSENY